MMNALKKTPIDYLTWGNHEADIDHKTVCRHIRSWHKAGHKFINSNMLDHEAMHAQQEYDVVEITSPNGKHSRKVGLCAVLSDDPKLYEHFKKPPGAFGGATITDPWEALTKYNTILKEKEGCDMVIPLQHLYVPDDHRTCREYDFPVILSGHDHHKVDEVVEGTRLLKPGMNAICATILEISWQNNDNDKPTIRSRFVEVSDWKADPVLAEECERAYDALLPLRNTELAQVPSEIEPLTSADSRGSVCSMGKYICTQIRASLNISRRQRNHHVDAVLLMGGNIRGNTDYEPGTPFSLETLESEIKSDEVVGVVPMPGYILAKGIEETHSGDPIPGWMQYDFGVTEDCVDGKPKVTHVAGQPLDAEKIYRVATKISDLTNSQSPTWTKFYQDHPDLLPPKGAYINIHAELLAHFARNLWKKLWYAVTQEVASECDLENGPCAEERLEILDSTGDGEVTVEEIQIALRELLGVSVDERELTLAKFVHSYADTTGDGRVTLRDFEKMAEELDDTNSFTLDKWRLTYRSAFKDKLRRREIATL